MEPAAFADSGEDGELSAVFQKGNVMKFGAGLSQSGIFAGILIVLIAATAWAQDAPPYAQAPDPQAAYPQAGSQAGDPQTEGAQAQDPPGRVARLQYMTGQISVQPEGTGDWVEGSATRPLTNADNVWADKDSRGELNVGTGVMRIDSETSLTLTNIDNNAVQVTLHQGALNVHVRHLENGEVWEVDTPNLAFTLNKSGDYRFDVDPNGDSTTVTVWKGQGEATGQGTPVRVHGGEWARFTEGNSLQHEINDAPPPDGFDEWCSTRDRRGDNSVSAQYVNPDVVGSEDLDQYGSWKNYSDYGPVWTPTAVAPGWAPYSYGHWIWVSPWGWTWADDAPWGFAPFHYGRWAYIGTSWGWIPGPYWARPCYAPALVGWFGGPGWGVGLGFGFGFGGPRFGWSPLGFREPFRPWYGVSRGYFRNVNVSNTRITNINRETNNFFSGRAGGPATHFANASKPGGFTAMSQSAMQHGLPVRSNSVRVSPADLRGAQSLSRVNINPTRETKVGSNARAGARPASNTFSRPTVSRMTPPAISSRAAASQITAARAGSGTIRGPQNSSGARSSYANTKPVPAPAGRTSPRTASGSFAQPRTEPSQMAMNRNVPRPPQSSMRSYQGSARNGLTGPSSMSTSTSRSASRPSAGSMASRSTMSARNGASPYGSSRSAGNSVSRPSGSRQPAPRSYSNPASGSRGGYGQGYSSRSYGSPYSGSYGGRGGYSGQAHAGPSYGGSYGGHGGNSAPSSHSYGGSSGGHGSSGSHGSGGHSSGSHGGGHR